ncbi:unnamed protein product [Prunus armeniaca]
MARGGSVCRPRFGAGSASRSSVTGRLPAAREEVPSVGRLRPGKGPTAAAPACAESALSWRRRSARVWSSGLTSTEDTGAEPCYWLFFFFPKKPIMRRRLEDSFILLSSAALLSSVTA